MYTIALWTPEMVITGYDLAHQCCRVGAVEPAAWLNYSLLGWVCTVQIDRPPGETHYSIVRL